MGASSGSGTQELDEVALQMWSSSLALNPEITANAANSK